MPSYTQVFGGNAVRAADQSLTKITLAANTTLVWPTDGGSPATSAIVEVNPTVAGRTLKLPDARNASNGETIQFRNTGANSFSVIDANNGGVLTIASGLAFTVYLSDNSTLAGSWSFWQAGAGSSTVSAEAIRGAGLDTLSGLLRVRAAAASYSVSAAFSDNDRGSIATWIGGSGTFSMPRANSVGNGWFMVFKNAGSGTLQIASTNSETFDGLTDITLATGEGATVYSNGSNFTFVRSGSAAASSSFSFVSVSIAGTGDYTLSALEFSRNAIRLTGTLTGNRNVIVPTNVRDYWIDNSTSGAFTVTVKTAAGSGVAVTQGKRQLLYCDGTNVVSADNDFPASVALPVPIVSGGTGSTTAPAALTALGGTTVGTQVFTAANAAAARSAISAATTGANTDISSVFLGNTGLKVRDTDASNGLSIIPGSNLSLDRNLTLVTGDADRTLDISAGSVTVTAAGAALTSGASAAAQRTTLGLGTIATQNANAVAITGGSVSGITDLAVLDGGTGASDAPTARSNLGLGSMATQNSGAVSISGGSISGITDLAILDGGTGASDAATARSNLGLGSMATQNANAVSISGGSISNITDLAVLDGGTGASTAAGARTNLGLGTAAVLDAGTGANQVVQLNGSAQLPAVDGSLLTGVQSHILLGTLTTTSGASQSLTGLNLTGYKFLRLFLNAVSTSAAASLNLGANNITTSLVGTSNYFGTVDIDLSTGLTVPNIMAGNGTVVSAPIGTSGISTASTSITLSPSTGTFDNGSITFYGVR